jgi:drug/metabolite transporter (DMT)-like permease
LQESIRTSALFILAGGICGPVLLMFGLTSTPASNAAPLLNLESVLTLVIAWVIFKENVDLRVFIGAVAIIAGAVILSWPGELETELGSYSGARRLAVQCSFAPAPNPLVPSRSSPTLAQMPRRARFRLPP